MDATSSEKLKVFVAFDSYIVNFFHCFVGFYCLYIAYESFLPLQYVPTLLPMIVSNQEFI